ncbi:hypothetical protein NLI96_g8962 [Meripilus lineatus]|uniref:Thioesterase domain-containing protein n=1 Tax=Meripilus lineatus TaxID=2056292 RepID=A0AAD5YFS6_9APHY|nr:hypothetical protein NLI96_g8962 [Physisporinus lineatus]
MSNDGPNLFIPSIARSEGNASQEVKEKLATIWSQFVEGPAFANTVARRVEVTEMSITPKAEEPKKVEARVVLELDVTGDMINGHSSLHGGCGAYLVDFCSSIALTLHRGHHGRWTGHVSSTLHTVYHAPAPIGSRLKIINTTVAVGARVMTARTEIYDKTNNRLVVSGYHVKMEPTPAKL